MKLVVLGAALTLSANFSNASVTGIRGELAKRLSSNATIFGPDDERYANATSRWSTISVPNIRIVVQPVTELDVSEVIKYCNDKNIDFLAYGRGHGWPTTLRAFDGVQIDMVNFKSISVQPDGLSAWFGGGTYAGLVSRTLWEKGYVTTTGACDCVGMVGSGLGGGHGRHESFYGMVSDNIRQLNIVLANSSTIRVNSSDHSDLLWAMKGAGHNFGVVTGFELNIYPRGPDTWHYHNYIWLGDKLEAIFEALNILHSNYSNSATLAINFGAFLYNSTVSTHQPVISWTFAFRGDKESSESALAAFDLIESEYESYGDVPYPEISKAQGTSESDPICQHHNKRIIGTADLQIYNLTAERRIFDDFTRRIHDSPELAQTGYILHEGYTSAGVDKFSSRSSAYPFRSDHLIMFFNAIVPPGSGLEKAAWEWANEVQGEWNRGQSYRSPDVYVNYASGPEPVEQKYGHESWRLESLYAVKRQYDPNNRFRFYNPIMPY